MQVCKYAIMQGSRYAVMEVQQYTHASIQVCKYASMQLYNYASMQVQAIMQISKCASKKFHFVNQALNPKASFTKIAQFGMLFENVSSKVKVNL